MRDMLGIQVVLLLALLALGMLSGAVPLRRRERAGSDSRLLDWGNAFAAGVFLGAGFVHMLPDAADVWTALGFDYPIAFLLAATAIVAMLFVEHVLPSEDAHHALHAPSAHRFAEQEGHAASRRAAYAILTGLSIHALLEGVALGVQRELGGALVLFAAIGLHKAVAGFALGVSLARSPLPAPRAWALLALFAAATPLGMVAGAVAGAFESRPAEMVEAVFLSLASGTFVYVATLDILREELDEAGGRLAKWVFVAAGTGVMALLALWV